MSKALATSPSEELQRQRAFEHNHERGRTWYRPEHRDGFVREFVEQTVKDGRVDWKAFAKLVSQEHGFRGLTYSPWTYREVQDAFVDKLLDLGLLSFYPQWNYHIMTSDNFGSDPFYGFGHLYFTRANDALGYARAVYAQRTTQIQIFRLQPAKKLRVPRQ